MFQRQNENDHACFKITKVNFFFKIHRWGLLNFYIYGYCKLLAYKKLLIQYSHFVWPIHPWTIILSHMTNQWLHVKTWHLVYISYQFSMITKCYLPCVFFFTLKICWYNINQFNWRLSCMLKHYKGRKRFLNTWTKSTTFLCLWIL
jgi:hypothetical protein